MSSIDNRVVNMIFDNQKFEKGIQTSIKSLESLKKGLDLEGASKGLRDIDKTAKGISFATLTNGVEAISVKFSTLGIVAITALQNITNSVINTGKKIVSSLTLDPVMDGFREYELKMDSVQTIMNGTGATLEEVSAKLNELNEYADRTIYSFGDMTSNIGKFTNAGVGLDDAVGAIQGVANAAALSGSNATQASHAMYNFAQALAAGYIKLIDWKSIETANMATVEFKTQLLESAVAAGTLTKSADGMYTVLTENGSGSKMKETISATKNFNDSLAYQWMTTEVLVKTLNDYADETTDIGKRAFKAATEIKTLTQLLDTMQEAVGSGWAQTWEILIGNFDEAKEVLTEISQAFETVMGASADARNDMLQSWKDLGGRTAIIDGMRNAIHGLATVITPIKEAFRDISPPMTAEDLLVIAERFKSFTENLKISEQTSEKLKNTFKGLMTLFTIDEVVIFEMFKSLKPLLPYISEAISGILTLASELGKFIVSAREALDQSGLITKIMEPIVGILIFVAEGVKNAIESIINSLASFKTVDTTGVEDVGKRFERAFKPFTAMANLVKGAFDIIVKVVEKVSPLFAGLASAIGKGLGVAHKAIMDWLNDVNFNEGLDLFNAGVFATVLLGIRKFTKSLGGIKEIIDGIIGTFEALQSRLKAGTLIKIATAIGILTASVVVLSMIDSDKLTTSLTAIAVLFTELFASMAIFEKVMAGSGFRRMTKIANTMILMSVAVLILATAMKKLSDLDWSGMSKGLIGIGVLMGELILAVKLMPNEGRMMKGAGSLILFATAINILANAVKKLGELDGATLTSGLIGVGAILLEIGIFMKVMDSSGLGMRTAAGILILTVGLNLLAVAVKQLGNMNTEAMIKGLSGLGMVLIKIGLFTSLMGGTTGMVTTAAGLTVLAVAMLIFSAAIRSFGSIPLENLLLGLIGLGSTLLLLVLALDGMKMAIPGAVALLIVAAAIGVLSLSLKVLGSMSGKQIAKSLLTLAGIFVILGVAGLVLAPLVPVLLGLGTSILLLGVGTAVIGAGLLLVAAGLSAFAIAITAAASAVVLAITAILGLVPMALNTVAYMLIAIARIIGEGGVAVINAFVDIILAIANAIIVLTPVVIEAIDTMLTGMINFIVDFVPRMVVAGMELIIGVLKGIRDNIKEVTVTAIEIVIAFIEGITEKLPDVIQAGFELVIAFINGLAEALRGNTAPLVEAISNLTTAVMEAGLYVLKNSVPDFLSKGKDLIREGLIPGVGGQITAFVTKVKELPSKAIAGISEFIGGFKEAGENLIGGFIQGIKNRKKDVTIAAGGVGDSSVAAANRALRIKSPSREFFDVGENAIMGLASGFSKLSWISSDAAGKVGQDAIASISKAVAYISDLISGDIDSIPTIRPVLDMTNVQNGIDSLSNSQYGLSIAGSMTRANSISSLERVRTSSVSDQMSSQKEMLVNHTGRITVEGVNNEGQVIAVRDLIVEEIKRDNRRLPNRASLYSF